MEINSASPLQAHLEECVSHGIRQPRHQACEGGIQTDDIASAWVPGCERVLNGASNVFRRDAVRPQARLKGTNGLAVEAEASCGSRSRIARPCACPWSRSEC